jgi:hypothetical protein
VKAKKETKNFKKQKEIYAPKKIGSCLFCWAAY